jgi:hypothetical protein
MLDEEVYLWSTSTILTTHHDTYVTQQVGMPQTSNGVPGQAKISGSSAQYVLPKKI